MCEKTVNAHERFYICFNEMYDFASASHAQMPHFHFILKYNVDNRSCFLYWLCWRLRNDGNLVTHQLPAHFFLVFLLSIITFLISRVNVIVVCRSNDVTKDVCDRIRFLRWTHPMHSPYNVQRIESCRLCCVVLCWRTYRLQARLLSHRSIYCATKMKHQKRDIS